MGMQSGPAPGIIERRERWHEAVREALGSLAAAAGLPPVDPALVVCEVPPRPELGDFAFPLFPLARVLRRPPARIASELATALAAGTTLPGEARAEGPYLNVRLDRPSATGEVLTAVAGAGESWGRSTDLSGARCMVEFSSPNTNKPLHIGHLRNDAIGESVSRILAAAGATVLKVNLINDRGVHICKSMLAYQRHGDAATPASAGVKGDHFVGDWYVRYRDVEQEDPAAEEAVRAMLRKWEEGDPEVRALWRKMNDWVMEGISETYRRTGISFDRIHRESELYELGRAEVLAGVGKGLFQRDPDGSVWVDLSAEGLDREVLLRSDGTSLYLTQDIGTVMRRFRDWPFDRMIYVVASEQRYHFQVLFRVLELLGFPAAKALHHLSYGMVHLPEGRMKSREGTVVDADDLLDELTTMAAEEIRTKERDEEVGDVHATAGDIALGALHYWLLATSPQKDMTFDPKESLSFTGNTGPYLQYTGARISSLLAKFASRASRYAAGRMDPSALSLAEEWEIVKLVGTFPETVSLAARELAPSAVAVHLFELCKAFSRWYQDNPILHNEDPTLVVSRIALVKAALTVLRNGLHLLAMPVLEAM